MKSKHLIVGRASAAALTAFGCGCGKTSADTTVPGPISIGSI